MTLANENKKARIEFKTTQEIKSMLQEAAAALGMDLSNFLTSVATQRAKEVLQHERMLVLSEKEWDRMQKALQSQRKAPKALKELMALEDFDE